MNYKHFKNRSGLFVAMLGVLAVITAPAITSPAYANTDTSVEHSAITIPPEAEESEIEEITNQESEGNLDEIGLQLDETISIIKEENDEHSSISKEWLNKMHDWWNNVDLLDFEDTDDSNTTSEN